MTTDPVLSFVIPVRNDAARLSRCLASIDAAAGASTVEVVVADNGSIDDTPATAGARGATVISVPGRLVGAVRNAGARASTGALIAFVDADHELRHDWIEAAVATMSDPDLAAAGCDYHPPDASTWVPRMYDRLRRHPEHPEEAAWLPSGNLVIRRSVFAAIGGFDESLESCEDVDLCQRIRHSGGRLLAAPALFSTHHGDPRTLRAVFFSELWRGRDNLRVTLRAPMTLSNLVGLGFTVLYLAGLVALVVGLAASPLAGPVIAIAGALTLAGLTGIRAVRLIGRGGRPDRALAFAVAFDAARALALVVRVRHLTRRKA